MKKHSFHVLLIFTGWLSIALGVLGIFLPVLPTTPFILLAAACFSRSSEGFHNWLLNHKYFGNIIRNFENGLGIEPRIRNRAIAIMWLGMITSMMIIYNIWVAATISCIGIFVTIYLFRLPAYQQPETIKHPN